MALLPVALEPVFVVFSLYGIYGHTEFISWLVALGGCVPHLSPGWLLYPRSPPMMMMIMMMSLNFHELALF